MSEQREKIQHQVMWNRFLAIVEEQAQSLVRTSFSVSTREAGDVSAGVFDRQGRMLAQAETGTPGHINSMAMAVFHFIDRFPLAVMKPGDCYITNDPWKGTGHLHDFTVVSPAFRNGEVVALFACTSHVVDIGGVGFSTEGRQIFHEGLQVPIMKFLDQGMVNETLLEIVRGNVREPIQVEGDLYALSACNDNAVLALGKLLDEYRIDSIDGAADFIIDSTRTAMLNIIAKLPKASASAVLHTDGYDTPVDLACKVTIGDELIVVDFEGSSPVSGNGINCPLCYSTAYASFAVKTVVAPKVPNNTGSLDLIKIVAPENSIVNAPRPCAVAVRSVVGHLVPDAVFGALHQILPGQVPAEGTGSLWGVKAGAGPGMTNDSFGPGARSFMIMTLHAGGAGARPQLDGLSATPFPSGVKNVPVEVTEAISPLIVYEKTLRQDSAGAGEARGGLGQRMVVGRTDNREFVLFATFDRVKTAPHGRDGGADGAHGSVTLGSGGILAAKGRHVIPAGDTVVLDMPGGGGFGDPSLRKLSVIEDDLYKGLISWEAAQRDYHVRRDSSGALIR
ncbi:MAG: N-methylhydantoinase [Sphingomonadales bacterium]|nr:N-methylhydantoinase [Sphingomonadales bacterium]